MGQRAGAGGQESIAFPRREAAVEKQAAVEAGAGLPGIPLAPPRKAAFKCALGGQCQIRTGSQPPPGLPARTRQTKQKLFKSGRGRRRGWGKRGILDL